MGSLILALSFAVVFFALIVIFIQGPIGKLVSCSVAFVVLLAIWVNALDS